MSCANNHEVTCAIRPSITEFYKSSRSKIVVALSSSDRGVFRDDKMLAKFTSITSQSAGEKVLKHLVGN